MFDLKCKRKGCLYNKNNNCTSKEVEVQKDTACKTYTPSHEGEVNEIGKVDQPPIRKNIKVDCKADCIFNTNKECTANGITVQTLDNTACPNCCTFQPK